jgi:hypothetical protein
MLKAVFLKNWYVQARNPKCPSVYFFYFIRGYIICCPSIIIYKKIGNTSLFSNMYIGKPPPPSNSISIFKHVYKETTTIELNFHFLIEWNMLIPSLTIFVLSITTINYFFVVFQQFSLAPV